MPKVSCAVHPRGEQSSTLPSTSTPWRVRSAEDGAADVEVAAEEVLGGADRVAADIEEGAAAELRLVADVAGRSCGGMPKSLAKDRSFARSRPPSTSSAYAPRAGSGAGT